jgi:hypothetical protein
MSKIGSCDECGKAATFIVGGLCTDCRNRELVNNGE